MANNFNTIYALQFNNYFNRILKRFDSMSDYFQAATSFETYYNINFNPNDGVTTTQVLNISNDTMANADYLIVCDPYDNIISRWFIVESSRTRNGQYSLQLQRDLVADHWESVKENPMFIEKATVQAEDPAIYNAEDMTFNEIKTTQKELNDDWYTPWIVGYIKGNTGDLEEATISFSNKANFTIDQDHDQWIYHNVTKKSKPVNYSFTCYNYEAYLNQRISFDINEFGKSVDKFRQFNDKGFNWGDVQHLASEKLMACINSIQTSDFNFEVLLAAAKTDIGWETDATLNDIMRFNDKFIRFNDGLYQCKVNITRRSVTTVIPNDSSVFSLFTSQFESFIDRNGYRGQDGYRGNYRGNPVSFYDNYDEYQVTLELAIDDPTEEFRLKIPASRKHLTDSPYDMFAIPFKKLLAIDSREEYYREINCDPEISFAIAQKLVTVNSANILDLQLLPYLPPIPGTQDTSSFIYLDDMTEGVDYVTITDKQEEPEPRSICFFFNKSTFTKRFGAKDMGPTEEDKISTSDPVELKVRALCNKYRIVSPNYSGGFDFNAIKAGYKNSIIGFIVDCTYIPQTPYIHVSPDFKGGLYGSNFGDTRGLICGGDFSLPMTSSEWSTYKAQNKNYQLAFDRSIENLEIQQHYQRVGDVVGALTGSVQGSAVGAQLGSKAGPYGAIAGAAIGGVASGVGGIVDYQINEALRKETLDYTKDQFGYRLGNIKAVPYSLNKTTAYTANNKIYPIIEAYTCTDVEKEALRNKIKYNGMTVMRVGTIQEFLHSDYSYIKGQLIRSESIHCDEHEMQALANELFKGLFMKG